MNQKKKTIFEKIIDREVPGDIFYEDDRTIAFLDIFPFDDGHSLVIPKKAYKTIFEMPEKEFLHLQKVIYKLAKNIKKKTGKDIVIYQRNGKGAGQEVPHVHFHILPRFSTEKERPLFNDVGEKLISDEKKNHFKKLFKI